MSKAPNGFPVTDAGNRSISVWFFHLATDRLEGHEPRRITRAQYAKFIYEGRVTRAIHGVPVVEV